MNPDDYDEDGNNIVPCPICLDIHCPGNQFDRNGNRIGDGKCPKEDEYNRHMNQTLSTDSFESSRGGLVCPECGKPANLTTGYCEQHRSKSPFTMTQDTPEPVKRMVNDKHHVALSCQVPEEVYEYYTNWLTTAATNLYNDAVREERERLMPWIEHDNQCVLQQLERGEPTDDGGYRTMYAGVWYKTDEEPDCDCGLKHALTPPTDNQ